MIPGYGGLSAEPVVAEYLPPDDRVPRWRETLASEVIPADWELGGVALGDTTQGLQVQVWEFSLAGTALQVRGETTHETETVLTVSADCTEVVGTFDGSMRPVVAYVVDGLISLRYYDATLPGYTIQTWPGARSPRLCWDDKRAQVIDADQADVLFFYLREESGVLGLYYRESRDRYGTERYLGESVPGAIGLGRVGMNAVNRIQIEFLTGSYTGA